MRTPVSGPGGLSLGLGLGLLLSALTAAPAAAQYVPPPAPVVVPAAGQEDLEDDGYYDAPQAQGHLYAGGHPIPYDQGGGFCNTAGNHAHPYPAFDQHLFQNVNGAYAFVGDPADFGYGGATYAYATNHPVAHGYGGGNCYIGWGHRHLYAPAGAGFALRGGSYYYNGGFAPGYYAQRPTWVNRVRPPHVYIGAGRHGGWGRPLGGHHVRGGWGQGGHPIPRGRHRW